MSLHLISMLVHAPKKVGPSVHVKHHPFTFLASLISLVVVLLHFNPLCLQRRAFFAPLPPCPSSNFLYTLLSQLLLDCFCGLTNSLWGYCDFLYPHPVGYGSHNTPRAN